MPRQIQIFISHSLSDYEDGEILAKYFREYLNELKYVNAYVRDQDPSTERLSISIPEEINTSEYHLLLVTENAIGSSWVGFEIGYSKNKLGSSLGITIDNTNERIFTAIDNNMTHNKIPDFANRKHIVEWSSRKNDLGNKTSYVGLDEYKIGETELNVGEYIKRYFAKRLVRDASMEKLSLIKSLKSKRCDRSQYEDLLDTFSDWSSKKIEAMSKQPLTYWFMGDGWRYRRRIRSKKPEININRLNIWSVEDIFPKEDRILNNNRIDSIIQKVTHKGEFNPDCYLCKIYYLLCLFWVDCHYPSSGGSWYILESTAENYLSDLYSFGEFIVYDDEFMFQAEIGGGERDSPSSYDFAPADQTHNAIRSFKFTKERLLEKGLDTPEKSYSLRVENKSIVIDIPRYGFVGDLIDVVRGYHVDKSFGCDAELIEKGVVNSRRDSSN